MHPGLDGTIVAGKKELIAVTDGYQEGEPFWKELLPDVKARGLEISRAWRSVTGRWASGRLRPSTRGNDTTGPTRVAAERPPDDSR